MLEPEQLQEISGRVCDMKTPEQRRKFLSRLSKENRKGVESYLPRSCREMKKVYSEEISDTTSTDDENPSCAGRSRTRRKRSSKASSITKSKQAAAKQKQQQGKQQQKKKQQQHKSSNSANQKQNQNPNQNGSSKKKKEKKWERQTTRTMSTTKSVLDCLEWKNSVDLALF